MCPSREAKAVASKIWVVRPRTYIITTQRCGYATPLLVGSGGMLPQENFECTVASGDFWEYLCQTQAFKSRYFIHNNRKQKLKNLVICNNYTCFGNAKFSGWWGLDGTSRSAASIAPSTLWPLLSWHARPHHRGRAGRTCWAERKF